MSNTSIGTPSGLLSVLTMIGATALTSTALATRPGLGAGDIARHFAAAGRVADMDGVFQVERIGQRDHIGDIGVHVVPGRRLASTGHARGGHAR